MTAGIENMHTQRWLKETLNADTALMTIATGGVLDQVSDNFLDAAYPMVTFQAQSPGTVLRGVGLIEVWVDTLWLVKASCIGSSFAPIVAAAARIHALLHGRLNITLPDGFLVECYREDTFQLGSVQGGKQYRHLGGIYRTRTQG